jgi:hypothetical protein
MPTLTENMRKQLEELARAALRRTEAGELRWRRTNSSPPEYFVSLGARSAIAIRRESYDPAIDESMVEYSLMLLSPDGDELAVLSEPRPRFDPGMIRRSPRTLEGLFEAAQASTAPLQEAVEDALKALQKAS